MPKMGGITDTSKEEGHLNISTLSITTSSMTPPSLLHSYPNPDPLTPKQHGHHTTYELQLHCIALPCLGTSPQNRSSSASSHPHLSSNGCSAICNTLSKISRSPPSSTRRISSSRIQDFGMNYFAHDVSKI